MNFNEAQVILLNAHCPEDVFPAVNSLDELHKAVRKWTTDVHPDKNPSSRLDAEAAFKRLTEWKGRAELKLRAGTWGDRKPTTAAKVTTPLGVYEIHFLQRREALFDSMSATLNGEPVTVHIPRQPRFELQVPAAGHALRQMQGNHAPELVEVMQLTSRRAYSTRQPADQWTQVSTLMAEAPKGLSLLLSLRITDALLEVVAKVQKVRIAHAAINPDTVWIRSPMLVAPVYLSDWHYSADIGAPAVYFNDTYADYLPWEIREGKATDCGTDLAATMMLLQGMLGSGDAPFELRDLIYKHMREGRARPDDVNACRVQLRETLRKI